MAVFLQYRVWYWFTALSQDVAVDVKGDTNLKQVVQNLSHTKHSNANPNMIRQQTVIRRQEQKKKHQKTKTLNKDLLKCNGSTILLTIF